MLDEAGCARPLDEAVDSLLDNLRDAYRLYAEGKDTQRDGAIEALLAVMEFLSLISGRLDHQQPINSLISALMSLNKGKVLPLLKPAACGAGSPPNSVGKESAKGIVACIV